MFPRGNFFKLALRSQPTRVEQLSGAPILGRLLEQQRSIRLGRKGLTCENALAYSCGTDSDGEKKSFDASTRNSIFATFFDFD